MPLYFISLVPPRELSDQIESLKTQIARQYDCKRALRLPAHITLQIPFNLEENMELNLLNILDDFSKEKQAFQIQLKNYGHFGNSTIYIGVEENEYLQAMHFDLKNNLQGELALENGKQSGKFSPHITLATRDISLQDFSSAWEHFKEQEFSAEFLATHLILFRHNGKTWDLYKSFKFGQASNASN